MEETKMEEGINKVVEEIIGKEIKNIERVLNKDRYSQLLFNLRDHLIYLILVELLLLKESIKKEL